MVTAEECSDPNFGQNGDPHQVLRRDYIGLGFFLMSRFIGKRVFRLRVFTVALARDVITPVGHYNTDNGNYCTDYYF